MAHRSAINEVKKAIAGRMACETWDERAKTAIAKNAELIMEEAVELAASKGKLPVNGDLGPIMHIVTNELITNIADRPDESSHLVPAVARRIGVMTGKIEAESPHHVKAAKARQSGATRA